MNFARIKGSHNALLSGTLAAEKRRTRPSRPPVSANDELINYENSWRDAEIGQDTRGGCCECLEDPLWSRYGLVLGVALGGLDMWTNEFFKSSVFGTLKHGKPDSDTLKPLSEVTPIVYPKPDAVLTFDKASSVYLSNTNHEEDQPVHLRLHDPDTPIRDNLPRFGEPAQLPLVRRASTRSCMRMWRLAPGRPVINAQNCVHCKTCDIKDPAKNIEWTPPEGGGGPNYPDM